MPVAVELDWLQMGPQSWDIGIETEEGPVTLGGGGRRLTDGTSIVIDEQPAEYERIYQRFVDLVATGASDVDLSPWCWWPTPSCWAAAAWWRRSMTDSACARMEDVPTTSCHLQEHADVPEVQRRRPSASVYPRRTTQKGVVGRPLAIPGFLGEAAA